MSSNISFVKFNESMIGSYVHMGGIATATVLSETFLNEWGDTCIDVIWDNEPGYRIRAELANTLHIKKPGKDPNIDLLLAIYNS